MNDDIVRAIQGAFAPFVCTAHVRSDGLVLLKVKHSTPTLFVQMSFMLASLRSDETRLAIMLNSLRERVEVVGYRLDPWP